MDYLVFDIECCDGRHICSFGYVIINDKFEILEKKDIVINPEMNFKLARAGFDPRIHLFYTQQEFYSQPNFAYYYDQIKELLTHKNRTLIGHSVANDIVFLLTAMKRYNLRTFKINAYDTQKIYSQVFSCPAMSLEKIIEQHKIEIPSLSMHKSCDDAEYTMRVLEILCKQTNHSINSLLKNFSQFLSQSKIIKDTLIKRAIRRAKMKKLKINSTKTNKPKQISYKPDITDYFTPNKTKNSKNSS